MWGFSKLWKTYSKGKKRENFCKSQCRSDAVEEGYIIVILGEPKK